MGRPDRTPEEIAGDNRPRFQDLANGHRDRALGNLVDRREPPFAHLLAAACVVETHDCVWPFGAEISGRIVEREMAF